MRKFAFVGGICALWASSAMAAHNGWMATMSPSQELHTPSVAGTNASCFATFRTDDVDREQINFIAYRVVCLGLTGVTGVHVHGAADADTESGVLATLYSNPAGSGAIAGLLTKGVIRRADLGDEAYNAFLSSLGRDSGYVNVHTTADPNGAVRGQIIPVKVIATPYLNF